MLESRNGYHAPESGNGTCAAPLLSPVSTDALPRVLAVLAEVLAVGEPLRVQIEREGLRALLVVEDAEAPPSGQEAPAESERETTATEDVILEVLRTADKPLKAVTIAHRAKHSFTNHFRSLVYGLVRKGRLVSCPDNTYQLKPETPAPTGETTPTEDEILEVLRTADKPLKGASIARRANCNFTDNFRRTIYRMRRKGTLIVVEDRLYWLAERGAPPARTTADGQ